MKEEKLEEFIKEWRKKNPEEFQRIFNILNLCERYGLMTLKPLMNPKIRFESRISLVTK